MQEKLTEIAKPALSWVYGPNDGELNGTTGFIRKGDELPKPILYHPRHNITTSLSSVN